MVCVGCRMMDQGGQARRESDDDNRLPNAERCDFRVLTFGGRTKLVFR